MNSLQHLLCANFKQHATRPAVQGAHITLSYEELARASSELAITLHAQGLRAGDVAPLLMARSALLVVVEVALARLGVTYAPIDLGSPEPRQHVMLQAIKAKLVIVNDDQHHRTPLAGAVEVDAQTTHSFNVADWWRDWSQRKLRHLGAADDATAEATADTTATDITADLWLSTSSNESSDESDADGRSVAYIMFTSGSTGVPKGVQVTPDGITRLVQTMPSADVRFDCHQRWAFLSSPAFDASTLEVWGALLNGGCCVVYEVATPSLDVLGEFLIQQRITDAWLTSALFNAMVDDQLPALGQLQQLLTGGERVSPQHARQMLQAHPRVRLINGYGPTENTTFTLCHTITLADTTSPTGLPIGRPVPGTQVRINPSSDQHPELGELWAAGAGLALGYLGDAELTEEKFVQWGGKRWYRTGDLVRLRTDGLIEFVGRTDRQIKLRGNRVELDEVELALSQCDGVADAVVLVLGEQADTRQMVAVYVSKNGASDAEATHENAVESITQQLRAKLPEPCIPSDFLVLSELPRTLNGKVNRRALEAQWMAKIDAAKARNAKNAHDRSHDSSQVSQFSDISAEIQPKSIAQQLQASLPEPCIPSDFLDLPELPHTPSGEVDRRAIEALWARQHAPTHRQPTPTEPNAAAMTMSQRLQFIFSTYAEHTAIESTHERLSYAELDHRSAVIANRLLALGVQTGDTLPLLLPRSTLLVLVMLAAVRLGVTYVPIDVANPAARITRILKVLRPRHAVTDWLTPVANLPTCICIDKSDLQQISEQPASPSRAPWVPMRGDAPLYIMFTSGSTGAPKGVVVPSRGLMELTVSAQWANFAADARWLMLTSPAFDISNIELWGALLNGACCVVQEGELPALGELAGWLINKHITHAQMSTALFNAMVDTQLPALSGLTQFITGGERASPPHMRQFLLAHPHVRLINGYGPTETTIYSLTRTVTLADTHSAAGVPIGRAVRGTVLRVETPGPIESAQSETTPPSTPHSAYRHPPSELLIGGAGVALGYLNDAEQTALKFIEHAGQRWYRTGDLVRQRLDGEFEFHGRADRQLKLQGQRIEMDEVELALAACPGVGEVVVLLRGNNAANQHLAACYSGLGGPAPDTKLVTEHLANTLPAAACPKQLQALDRLPRNLNGKVDKNALIALLDEAQRLTAPLKSAEQNLLNKPQGEFEVALASIWQELLPQVSLTRSSHFLRIGGTSLLALHVAALVHKRMNRHLAPIDVLRHPVLAAQAAWVAQIQPAVDEVQPSSAHEAVNPHQTNVALSHGQQSLIAASQLDPTGCAYLVHVGLHWKPHLEPQESPLSWAAWRQAFTQLAQRHPALRLSAHHDGQDVHAVIQPDLAPNWWYLHPELDSVPQDLRWPPSLLTHINRPLTQGSMRVDCWPLRTAGAVLIWTVHHHVIDEASIEVALQELNTLLQGNTLGDVHGTPFAFQAFEAAHTENASHINTLATNMVRAMSGSRPPLERAPAPGREVRFELPPQLQKNLQQRCQTWGCTPFTPLLCAYNLAVQEVFGASFRFVSTPFSRRCEPELMEPINYLLDVRFIEAGARPFEALHETLARVQRAVLHAQQPTFQNIDTVTQAVAQLDPQVAQGLNQFNFTWRINPTRSVPLASHTAQLLRVQQTTARFPLSLHTAQFESDGNHLLGTSSSASASYSTLSYSIEAIESAFQNGLVAAVARAFEHQLVALCADEVATAVGPLSLCDLALKDHSNHASAVTKTTASAAVHLLDSSLALPHTQLLRTSWARLLNVPESSVEPSSHFLRSGGSSLTAMRLGAQLRRSHDLRLDIAAFLSNPTFAQLCALCAPETTAAAHQSVNYCTLVGPTDFQRAVLLVPGSGGHVAGMYALAAEMQQRMSASRDSSHTAAVAIFDLNAVLHAAPAHNPLPHVLQCCKQAVQSIGADRLSGLAGYSLGALLLLRLAAQHPADCTAPLWLIDGFNPRFTHNTLARRIERNLAWLLLGGKPAAHENAAEIAVDKSPPPPATATTATPEQWDRLIQQLDQNDWQAKTAHIHLIQATGSVSRIGLLHHRQSNGFAPRDYASWQVHRIQGEHLDLPRHLASQTANVMVGGLLSDLKNAG
jgi:amino acid adenylation domain-containing protein